MPTVVQFRRGTTTQNNNFTGAAGELSVDTTLDTIRVHDGSQAGGFALTGNAAMIGYVTNAVSTANIGQIGYTDNKVTTANVGMVGFVGSSVTTANIGMVGFVGSSVSTANIGMIGFVGLANTITATGITRSNLAMKGYVDNEISTIPPGYSNVQVATFLPTYTGEVKLASITKSGTSNVGNIGQTNNRFHTIHAKASSAQYADLAEAYVADASYEPGTVLAFGGENEVTLANANDTRIAGVVSTSPAFTMNDSLQAENVAMIALTGRVPTKVVGPISKGDMIVCGFDPIWKYHIDTAGYNGVGKAMKDYIPGSVIGKSLEEVADPGDTETPPIHTIEVVVGRL